MDIQRQTRALPWYRKHWYFLPIACFAIGVVAYASLQKSVAYSAAIQHLAIGEVQRGKFAVTVRGSGVLTPTDVRWLAANVSGRVEKIHAKPGTKLQQGDLIVEMSNPELEQDADEIAWELEALQAENTSLEVSLESQLLDQQAQVLNAKSAYESAKINHDAQKTLMNEGNSTVSLIEFKRAALETEQFLASWKIEQQRLIKLQESKDAQIQASQARYQRLQKSLSRARAQIADLMITASLDGVIQELPLEAGQQVNMGDNVARLARQDRLFAELQISERQVNGVKLGHSVEIDTRRSIVAGEVIRIAPNVLNGVVQVDVAITEPLPAEARPELTVDGTISVAEIDDALFVGRPSFSESGSTTSLYRLSADSKFAVRVPVTFGVGSASQIQILDGLQPGQRIVLSDSTPWQHLDRISLQ